MVSFSLTLPDLATAALSAVASPRPTVGLALGRVVLGLVLVYDAALLLRARAAWFGEHALRPRAAGERAVSCPLDLFALSARLGLSEGAPLWLHLALALAFTIGLATPLSGLALLLSLLSLRARNPWISYGGDAFARTVLLLMLVSPCAASLSVDAWLRGDGLGLDLRRPLWGARLILAELVLLYLYNFLCKIRHRAWRDGSAMFYVLRNRDFTRRPLPRLALGRAASRALTWGTLALELALAPGLLHDATAAPLWLAAIAFHLGIALVIDVHLFSQVMVAALVASAPASVLHALGLTSGGAPAPHAGAALSASPAALLGATLCALYLIAAALWRPPVDSRASAWLRRALAPAARVLGWTRGWHLFVGDPPCGHEVELHVVAVLADGCCQTWSMDHAQIRVPAGHRRARLRFTLLRDAHARRVFAAFVRRDLARAGVRPRALAAELLLHEVVTAAPDRSSPPDADVTVHLQIARATSTSAGASAPALDLDAGARLLTALRGPATRRATLELLLLAATHAIVDARACVVSPALAALRDVLRQLPADAPLGVRLPPARCQALAAAAARLERADDQRLCRHLAARLAVNDELSEKAYAA